MKKIIVQTALMCLFTFSSILSFGMKPPPKAPGHPKPPGHHNAPFDGGATLIIGAAIAFGIRQAYNARKNQP